MTTCSYTSSLVRYLLSIVNDVLHICQVWLLWSWFLFWALYKEEKEEADRVQSDRIKGGRLVPSTLTYHPQGWTHSIILSIQRQCLLLPLMSFAFWFNKGSMSVQGRYLFDSDRSNVSLVWFLYVFGVMVYWFKLVLSQSSNSYGKDYYVDVEYVQH